MLFHPTDLRLGLFADGELPPPAVRRVARHMQRCGRCRARVTATRRLSRDAKDLRIPPPPSGLRSRVLQGLAVGGLVIVPVADPLVRVWPWRRLAWLGVTVLVIVGGVRLMFNNQLYSETSVLEFTPSNPTAGEEITVTYHASGRLATESTLRLRAEYRGAGDRDAGYGVLHIGTMLLTRASDRTYTARVRLPVHVVYARFAVEDLAGEVVDHRGSMGWELLVYANGHPSYQALRQRFREAYGRDNWEALATAVEATTLYPDRVEAWSMRGAVELEAYGPDARDSLSGVHAQEVRALDDRLAHTPLAPEELGVMQSYARQWDVVDVEAWWHLRVLREAPRSRTAARLRTVDILLGEGTPPRERLRLLETLYEDVGAVDATLPIDAFEVAHDLGDPDACLRWAQRLFAIEPWQRLLKARELLSFPSLSDTVLAWIDGEIARLGRRDDSARPLFASRSRYRRSIDSARFDLLGLKGQALLGRGDTLEALVYLDSAVARGWDIARFRAAATARVAAADTLGAARLLARIAVDPGVGNDDADRRGRRLLTGSDWEAETARARSAMLRETRRQAEPRTLFDSVRVTRRTGETVDLRETLQGHVTVVAFWYPCSSRPCLGELEDLSDLVAGLPGAPRLIIVSRRALEPADWARLDGAGVARFVTVDRKGDAAQAFGVWGTSGVFVSDPGGVIQYQQVSPDDLPRCVMTLDWMQDVVTEQSRADARAGTAKRP